MKDVKYWNANWTSIQNEYVGWPENRKNHDLFCIELSVFLCTDFKAYVACSEGDRFENFKVCRLLWFISWQWHYLHLRNLYPSVRRQDVSGWSEHLQETYTTSTLLLDLKHRIDAFVELWEYMRLQIWPIIVIALLMIVRSAEYTVIYCGVTGVSYSPIFKILFSPNYSCSGLAK